MDAEELRQQIRACTRCSIGKLGQRENAVPGWMGSKALVTTPLLGIMCEAPGAQEDATGLPLVGKAGQLFDKLLLAAGMDRQSLLLMNRVRCRPPNNLLKNHSDAVEACDEWTKAELELYNPAVVVLMGATAMESVFGTKPLVGLTRGQVRTSSSDFKFGARTWVATYHPASLFRPSGKANLPLVVADLMLARTLLNEAAHV